VIPAWTLPPMLRRRPELCPFDQVHERVERLLVAAQATYWIFMQEIER
jgi:hypothetical protein